MKTTCLTIITLLFLAKAYAQETVKMDSTVAALQTYLLKRTLPPAVMVENHVQGTVVVGFKIDDNKNITDLYIVKSFARECDASVLRTMSSYAQTLSLPTADYTAGIHFLIEDSQHKIKTVPFDKSIYQNYLFDVDIRSIVKH
jgi:Gram-negative bacterial TonB protein C-terminal